MTIEEKLAKSLTAESTELIPFLPYLLQDLYELGSSPKDMVDLISRNIDVNSNTRVLDLACGKGAVSIAIAKAFGCKVKGIDLMHDFINVACEKAKDENVAEHCAFEVGDINQSVLVEKDYDIVILGAVGDVLGNQGETLIKLALTVKNGGFVLIDDGYERVSSESPYLTADEWREAITRSGYERVDELYVKEEELTEVLEEQKSCLTRRVEELKSQYPDKARLFDGYLVSQFDECDALENEIDGVTMLLRKL